MDSLSPELLGAIRSCFQALSPDLSKNGAYYEFGVYQGASLCWAANIGRDFVGEEFRYYGFDSFLGLPLSGDMRAPWFEGAYKAELSEVERNIKDSGADREKIVLTAGFFSSSLFREFWDKHGRAPAILVIDSDLYESCKEVLDFFGPKLVKGSLVILDDWGVTERGGEQRAWREFKKKYPLFQEKRLFNYETDGIVFEVIAASGEH